MFTGEDRQALQTSNLILNAVQKTVKTDEYFWHYHNELVLDLQQRPDEPIHSLNTCIIQPINNWQFSNSNTKETFKIIILQHAVKYHNQELDSLTRPVNTHI